MKVNKESVEVSNAGMVAYMYLDIFDRRKLDAIAMGVRLKMSERDILETIQENNQDNLTSKFLMSAIIYAAGLYELVQEVGIDDNDKHKSEG